MGKSCGLPGTIYRQSGVIRARSKTIRGRAGRRILRSVVAATALNATHVFKLPSLAPPLPPCAVAQQCSQLLPCNAVCKDLRGVLGVTSEGSDSLGLDRGKGFFP